MAGDSSFGCMWIVLLLPFEIVKDIVWLNLTTPSSFWHKLAYVSLVGSGAIFGILVLGLIIYRLFFYKK